jgi:hypothetical protein
MRISIFEKIMLNIAGLILGGAVFVAMKMITGMIVPAIAGFVLCMLLANCAWISIERGAE